MADHCSGLPPTSRRQVVRGISWTLPVVAVATTAPAFAASPAPCPLVPAASQWTPTSISGTLSSKADDYQWYTATDKWVIYKDNGSTTTSLTFTSSSPTFAVVPGLTLQGGFTFYWQFGNSASSQSTGGTFDILINGIVVKSIATRSAAAGAAQATTTQSFPFTVPAGTTSIVVTYRFVLSPRSGVPASDDIIVSRLGFSNCTVN